MILKNRVNIVGTQAINIIGVVPIVCYFETRICSCSCIFKFVESVAFRPKPDCSGMIAVDSIYGCLQCFASRNTTIFAQFTNGFMLLIKYGYGAIFSSNPDSVFFVLIYRPDFITGRCVFSRFRLVEIKRRIAGRQARTSQAAAGDIPDRSKSLLSIHSFRTQFTKRHHGAGQNPKHRR